MKLYLRKVALISKTDATAATFFRERFDGTFRQRGRDEGYDRRILGARREGGRGWV